MRKKSLSPQTDPLPQPSHRLNKRTCPYWDAASRACLVVEDGLFLPIEQHVINYCLSSHYPSCRYYEVPGEIEIPEDQLVFDPANRRRSTRIPSRNTFRYSEISRNNQTAGIHENDAWTIDVSDHGIRFATRESLLTDSTIDFSLEVNETGTLIQGVGKVVWSQPLANTPLFHAGMAFTKRMVSSLRHHHAVR